MLSGVILIESSSYFHSINGFDPQSSTAHRKRTAETLPHAALQILTKYRLDMEGNLCRELGAGCWRQDEGLQVENAWGVAVFADFQPAIGLDVFEALHATARRPGDFEFGDGAGVAQPNVLPKRIASKAAAAGGMPPGGGMGGMPGMGGMGGMGGMPGMM